MDSIPWNPSAPDPAARVVLLNTMIENYSVSTPRVRYADYHSFMKTASGGLRPEYTYDGVHVTAQGYEFMMTLIYRTLFEPLPPPALQSPPPPSPHPRSPLSTPLSSLPPPCPSQFLQCSQLATMINARGLSPPLWCFQIANDTLCQHAYVHYELQGRTLAAVCSYDSVASRCKIGPSAHCPLALPSPPAQRSSPPATLPPNGVAVGQ